MTRLQALVVIHTSVIAGLDKRAVAHSFVSTLARYESIYHFDEDAHDIMEAQTGATLFSYEEAELCNSIRDYCYSDYLFELSIRVIDGESI